MKALVFKLLASLESFIARLRMKLSTRGDEPARSTRWKIAALSYVGCKREENEDNHYITPDRRVVIVADGMGGHAGGAVASALAVEAVELAWRAAQPDYKDCTAVQNWIDRTVASANESILSYAAEDADVEGMGSTAVLMVIGDGFLRIGHIGDSRAYNFSLGKLIRLTRDHSEVQQWVDARIITAEEARSHPNKHIILRWLGEDPAFEVEHQLLDQAKKGDCFLLCSDGLTDVLRDEIIESVLNNHDQPDEACAELIRLTVAGGAPDNVTVIIIHFV